MRNRVCPVHLRARGTKKTKPTPDQWYLKYTTYLELLNANAPVRWMSRLITRLQWCTAPGGLFLREAFFCVVGDVSSISCSRLLKKNGNWCAAFSGNSVIKSWSIACFVMNSFTRKAVVMSLKSLKQPVLLGPPCPSQRQPAAEGRVRK